MSRRVKCILCGKEFDVTQDDTIVLLEHIRTSHPNTVLSESDTELLERRDSKKTKMEVNNSRVKNDRKGKRPSKEDNRRQSVRKSVEDTFFNADDCMQMGINLNCPEELPNKPDEHSSSNKDSKRKEKSSDQTSTEIFVGSHFRQASTNGSVIIVKQSDSPTKGVSKTQILYKRKYKVQKPLSPRSQRSLFKTSIEKWRPGQGHIFCPNCGSNKRPIIKTQADRVSYSPLGAACILTCWPFCFLPCLFPPPAKEYLHCSVCNNFLGVYDRKTEVIEPNKDNLRRRSSQGDQTQQQQQQTPHINEKPK